MGNMEEVWRYLLVGLCGCTMLFSLLSLILSLRNRKKSKQETEALARLRQEIGQDTRGSLNLLVSSISENQRSAAAHQREQAETLRAGVFEHLARMEEKIRLADEREEKLLVAMRETLERSLNASRVSSEEKLEAIRKEMEQKIEKMQAGNEKKLDEMRQTVDEKLQKTLEERISRSFEAVNQNLAEVYKGLGDMQKLASDVGSLKEVLSNVKTRGGLGEIRLGAILSEILAPEQYEADVETVPGSGKRVEFALKMPGDGNGCVYLPIDSKFPLDAYQQLLDAYETHEKVSVEAAWKVLEQRLRLFAKEIREKYISVPYTTDFAILFLPTEGLYAEAVRRGMVEVLQRDHHINLAGPTTMAALLNSLQMGFRTLAIQKRSGEVWKLLGAVKTEFGKFAEVLQKHQERLDQAGAELNKLIGTRTNQINRRLREVEYLPELQSVAYLEEDQSSFFDEISATDE